MSVSLLTPEQLLEIANTVYQLVLQSNAEGDCASVRVTVNGISYKILVNAMDMTQITIRIGERNGPET